MGSSFLVRSSLYNVGSEQQGPRLAPVTKEDAQDVEKAHGEDTSDG